MVSPGKKEEIRKAKEHQNWVKFHSQIVLNREISAPLTNFLAMVKSVLPHDKFRIFGSLFRFPVKTNELTGIAFDKLSRIFDGRNPAFSYQFLDTDSRDDWEYYRTEVLDEPSVWQNEAWEQFKTEINSVLIVDMPDEPIGYDKRPSPYFYWLPIDRVISYSVNPITEIMDWIIFWQGDSRIVVIDGGSYRVFEYKDSKVGNLILENPHNLSYCPARFFWNTPINIRQRDVKQSVLTKELESLDWYLFFLISKRVLDIYGSYPIYSGYAPDCTYSNEANGDHCDGGFLKDRNEQYLLDERGLLVPCPICNSKRIAGPGSFVEVPIPGENQPDLSNPVQMLAVDRSSLDYNVSELNRLKEEIVTGIVGLDNDIINDQALNEKQIEANFESQSAILNRVKKGFEKAQEFVDGTICRLRYGNSFIAAKINYGTEFYTLTSTEIRERYKLAKESGASEAELDALQDQIIETEYRHNPMQMMRMMTLKDLEPLRHLTRDEVLTLREKGLISEDEAILKLDFVNFIRRFERENTDIVEFGSLIEYPKKIETIKQKLQDYVNEKRKGLAS